MNALEHRYWQVNAEKAVRHALAAYTARYTANRKDATHPDYDPELEGAR